jgi:hypothetical protein
MFWEDKVFHLDKFGRSDKNGKICLLLIRAEKGHPFA